jgi:predicted SAM-dependent methyltransferase
MKLHIGGVERKEGWHVLNARPAETVDFVGDIRDLSRFADGSIEAVYASHVLEHTGLRDLEPTLAGIHRVLCDGGTFYVSVPDLDILCRHFLSPELTPQQKFQVMRMMFGGQTHEHDFHHVGFNRVFLQSFLARAGFRRVERVASFGLFADTSEFRPFGTPISLNMVAVK